MSPRIFFTGSVRLGLALVVAALVAPVAMGQIHGRIAYGDDQNRIRVMDVASGITRQVPLPPIEVAGFPQWSPDGQWLTFRGGVPFNSQIFVVKPDGSGFRQVTNGAGDLVHPSFSPDGTKIVYHQVYGNLYIIDCSSDHGNPPATQLPVTGSHTHWSPGTKIVYTNWGFTYESDVFVYDPATGANTQVTHHSPGGAFIVANWSPDGTKLAISGFESNGTEDVYLSAWDGSSWSTPVKITGDWADSNEGWPAWSPDGQYIVFYSDRSGDLDIWYMPVNDLTNRVNVTNTAGINEYGPVWTVPADATPPVAVCRTDKSVLWPPNHQIEQVTVWVRAQDDVTPADQLRYAGAVSSSEPDNARGDGNFPGDVNGQDGYTQPVPFSLTYDAALGCAVGHLALRAERGGSQGGRVYTIVCTVADAAGNVRGVQCAVSVPHDRGKK